MTKQFSSDIVVGTGSAINVELGWIPDYVEIINLTDGDKVHINHLTKVVAFTSGGTTEPGIGDKITGATSGGTAIIKKVMVTSGTWAGGDAAGFLLLDQGSLTGSLTAENAGINGSGSDDITLSAAPDQDGIDIDTEVAGTTTAATNCIAYVGSDASASKGFTIGATISESGKLLGYKALRN